MDSRTEKVCEICATSMEPLSVCTLCGAQVCNVCLESNHLCAVCFEAKCYICSEYLSSRACDRCGRLVCEDHGIRVNEATICDNCQAKEQ